MSANKNNQPTSNYTPSKKPLDPSFSNDLKAIGHIQIRSRYDHIEDVGLSINPDEKLTKDSFKDETDINLLVARYQETGLLPDNGNRIAQYLDVSDVPDYQTARDTVLQAEAAFAALPASVRDECRNDPAVFLERVEDLAFRQKHNLEATPSPASSGAPAPSSGAPAPSSGGQPEKAGTEPASPPSQK